MDDQKPAAPVDNVSDPAPEGIQKTKNTIPTLYPDIEFVNRTLP